MKTSDEKLNDALRAALKRKFDDLEQQPVPSAFSRITEAVRQGSTGYYLLTITLAILFVGVGLIRKERSAGKPAMAHVKLTVAPPVSSLKNKMHADAVIGSASPKLTVDQKVEKKDSNTPTLRTQSVIKQRLEPLALNEDREVKNKATVADNPSGMIKIDDQTVEHTTNQAAILPDSILTVTSNFSPELLQPIGIAALHVDANLPAITEIQNPVKSRPAQTVTMLFNVQTLYTLQRLTIHQGNGGEFRQNVRFGRGIGRESIGYKVSTGFELKGFEYLFSYSHFWQGIYYDAATSDYVVDYSRPDQYTVTREWQGGGGTIHRPYMLAGFGVNKKFTWGKSPAGRNFGKAGIEYSRALDRNQGIFWINASAGREFYINKNTLISMGPFAEFTPFKLATGDPRFSIQPYRVGLTLGIGVIPR